MSEPNNITSKDEVLPSALNTETEKPEGDEISQPDLDKIAGGTHRFA